MSLKIIQNVTITVTQDDDSQESFVLETPTSQGEGRIAWGFQKLVLQENFRDRDLIFRRGYNYYQFVCRVNYAFHEMDLRTLITAKSIELKVPPDFDSTGDYQAFDVLLQNDEIVRNWLNGLVMDEEAPVDDNLIIPFGRANLVFIGKDALTFDEVLTYKFWQTDLSPSAPTNLSLDSEDAGNLQVTFSWDENSEPDIAGYNFYYRTGADPFAKDNTELITDPSAYVLDGISLGTSYDAHVKAVDESGNESDASNELTFSLKIPPNDYFAYSIDNDALLRIATVDDATVVETYNLGVEASAIAWNPLSEIVIATRARRLRKGSFDEGTQVLSEDFNVGWTSTHGLHVHDVMFDSEGNVYVGHYDGAFNGSAHPFKKYDKDNGSLLWASFGGLGSDSRNVGVRVAFATGDICYAGFCQDFGGLQKGYLAQIDKSNGSQVWRVNFGDDRPNAMVGDIDGGCIVALGDKSTLYLEESHILYDALNLRKYDSDGNLVWSITETNMNKIVRLEVDLDGNIYVGGEGATGANGVVVKYSAGDSMNDPVEQWVRTFNNGAVWVMGSDGSDWIFVGNKNGRVVKIAMSDGSVDYNVDKDASGSPQLWGIDVHPGNPATIGDFG